MERAGRLILVSFLLVLPACTKQSERAHEPKKHSDHYVRVQEARLNDVPFPLGSEPLPQFFTGDEQAEISADNIMLAYANNRKQEDLMLFYQQEMERLGWRHVGYITRSETLLHFDKPSRFCTISLRPGKTLKSEIVIFAGNKLS